MFTQHPRSRYIDVLPQGAIVSYSVRKGVSMPSRIGVRIALLLWGTVVLAQSSAKAPTKSAQISCPSASTEVTLHGSASSTLPILDILRCDEEVTLLGKEGEWYKVHTQSGKDGYVREIFVREPSAEDSSRVVQEIGPDTVIKQPSRMPALPKHLKVHGGSEDYSLSLRVLQTEQVPYTVQYGGGQVSTSCSINGTTNTTGSAIASGNVAFGNATSYTNLSMNCNSYQAPPMGWRHVLNAMLVVASNGNAYIMACDAAWRWSKCRGLVVGDAFRAKMTGKGLAVEYLDGRGKPKEATYTVLQSKVVGN